MSTSEVKLSSIEFHAANRKYDASEVKAIADSIKDVGQLAPVVLRKIAGTDLYECIAGERRCRALKVLKRRTVDARIVEATDLETMAIMAAENAARGQLTIIDKARGIKAYVDAGGSLQDAAAAYRVSKSQASNLQAILSLERAWLDRVAKGEVAQTVARELCRLPQPLIDLLDDLFQEGQHWHDWTSRDWFARIVDNVLSQQCRCLDRKIKAHKDGAPLWREIGCQLKLTDDLRDELKPFRFTGTWKRNKLTNVEFTTNVKRFDELHSPLVEANRERALKRSNGRSNGASANGSPKVNPEERVKEKTAAWVIRLIRASLTWRYINEPSGKEMYAFLMCVLPSTSSLLPALGEECDMDADLWNGDAVLLETLARDLPDHVPVGLVRRICYPSIAYTDDPSGVAEEPPHLSRSVVLVFADAMECTLDECWSDACTEGPERELLRIWLGYHTKDQLVSLVDELKLFGRDASLTETARKPDLVDGILGLHTKGRPLRQPKSIKAVWRKVRRAHEQDLKQARAAVARKANR